MIFHSSDRLFVPQHIINSANHTAAIAHHGCVGSLQPRLLIHIYTYEYDLACK